MHKRYCLTLSFAALAPTMAFGQSVDGQFRSPLSPPPLPHSPQNPLGKPAPSASATTTPNSTPGKLGTAPRRAHPGGNALSGLVGYVDSETFDGPDELDQPVTGYGNEALWDDVSIAGVPPQY